MKVEVPATKSIHTFELAHSSPAPGPLSQLSSLEAFLGENQAGALKLLSSSGDEIEVPGVLFPVLRQLLQALIAGERVLMVSGTPQLTTQQAADILNVSRPYLVKLLEDGKLPFMCTGKHRRINIADLMAYKGERDAQRRHGARRGLAELTGLGEEMGDYD